MADFSLEQIRVFVAVVDSGGFAAAGRDLGRAQSAITYAIRALEEAVGLVLFDRAGYRPVLTDAGRSLLPRARRLLSDVEDVHRQAGAFARGVEASIALVVDPFVPLDPVARALRELHLLHPSVEVRMRIESRAQATSLLQGNGPALGVLTMTPGSALGSEFESLMWRSFSLVAVAAPVHPLASEPAPIPVDATRGHMQVVWTPGDATASSADMGVHALDRWYVTDWHAKLALIREGVGWGSLPEHLAQPDIEAGRLVALDMQSWEGNDRMPTIPLAIVRRAEAYLRPATRTLIECLRRQSEG